MVCADLLNARPKSTPGIVNTAVTKKRIFFFLGGLTRPEISRRYHALIVVELHLALSKPHTPKKKQKNQQSFRLSARKDTHCCTSCATNTRDDSYIYMYVYIRVLIP